jgi:hypothetical protein
MTESDDFRNNADWEELKIRVSQMIELATFSLGLGHPRVTQASPKGVPSVTQESSKGRPRDELALFATTDEKRRGGSPKSRIAKIAKEVTLKNRRTSLLMTLIRRK